MPKSNYDSLQDEIFDKIFKDSENKKDNGFLSKAIHDGSKLLERKNREKNRIYASESGHCSRKSALLSAIPDNILDAKPPATLFYMEVGKCVENSLLHALNNSNILIYPFVPKDTPVDRIGDIEQIRIPDAGLNLGGKIDAVVWMNNKVTLVEMKTFGAKNIINPQLERPQHYTQARLYSALTGLDVVLLYMSRNISSYIDGQTLKICEFFYKHDRGAGYNSVFQSALSYHYLNMGYEPPIPDYINAENKKTMCSYCSLVSHCWENNIINHKLKLPDEGIIKIIEENAHIDTAKLLNANAIKNRRIEFLDNLRKTCNPAMRGLF